MLRLRAEFSGFRSQAPASRTLGECDLCVWAFLYRTGRGLWGFAFFFFGGGGGSVSFAGFLGIRIWNTSRFRALGVWEGDQRFGGLYTLSIRGNS